MTDYTLTWIINIEADSPEEAVEEALLIQRDPNSLATIFDVHNVDSDETHQINGCDN